MPEPITSDMSKNSDQIRVSTILGETKVFPYKGGEIDFGTELYTKTHPPDSVEVRPGVIELSNPDPYRMHNGVVDIFEDRGYTDMERLIREFLRN